MMKKILAVALVIMALFCSMAVNAERITIDFSAYTLDELVEIRTELENEIMGRIGFQNPNMIYRGKYVVGKDIAAGQYTFICLEASLGSSGLPDEGEIEVYRIDDQEEFEKDGYGTTKVFSADDLTIGSGVIITLEPGMVLKIEDCSGTLVVCNQGWIVRN